MDSDRLARLGRLDHGPRLDAYPSAVRVLESWSHGMRMSHGVMGILAFFLAWTPGPIIFSEILAEQSPPIYYLCITQIQYKYAKINTIYNLIPIVYKVTGSINR